MARRRTASKDRGLPMAPFGLKPSDAACCTATSGLLYVVEICSREVVQSLYANLVGPTQRHQFDAIRRRFFGTSVGSTAVCRYLGAVQASEMSDRMDSGPNGMGGRTTAFIHD